MSQLSKYIDGINCINVYSKSYTPIGRFYSNFAFSPFTCEDGFFDSIEAYWYWIRTDGLSPRNTHGNDAKQKGKLFRMVNQIDEDKIRKAIDIKLKSNLNFIRENENFELSLVHYYDYGDRRVDGGYSWILEHLEMRREQLNTYFIKKQNELQ